MNVKNSIIDFANSIGIEYIGFCDTDFASDFLTRLLKRKEDGNLSGFEEPNEMKRIDVNSLLDNAKTIISIAVPYKAIAYKKTKNTLYFSKSSFGLDYHKVVNEKLKRISEFITSNFGAKCIYFCDTGPLHDREIAKKCGIGFYGKNSCIINPKYGSYIFLGEIITDIFIERSSEIESGCDSCDLCIKSCPAKALGEAFEFKAKKCLSYITQKKDGLTDKEADLLGLRLYGCDSCQDACPYNKNALTSPIKEFEPESWTLSPDPEKILEISNSEFKKTYGRTSSGWRGKKNLQRNMIIALGNSGNKEYIPVLQKYYNKLNLDNYIERSIKKLER